jgi:RND family efflux transporter MFP subunit
MRVLEVTRMRVLLDRVKVLMKKKVPRIALVFVLCVVAAVVVRTAVKSDSARVPEYQVATVQRGDLTVDITASGNLALSLKEGLAFEISGTVDEVLVEEGDSVEEGQVLARLDTSEWEKELITLEYNLLQAEQALDEAEGETTSSITGDIVTGTTSDAKEIEMKELQVELAEKRLAEALDASPEITALFDGFITEVNVEGGDEVTKGTVAVTLAGPDKFEADILVGEMDIFQLELGGEAWVEADALEGLSLPAEVTHISPTATIQSGVVNYEVKVELQSLEELIQEQQDARQEAMEGLSSGEFPEPLRQAIEEGQITQKQAEEMMERMQEGQGWRQGQSSTAIPEDLQLREGLTVIVSIVVAERSDVLLVPNGAIISQGGRTYVQVLSPDGTIEERAITTGISDWQYTEVTSGLSEGEEVIVPQGPTTSTTSEGTWEGGPQEGMMMPGMGRLGA